MLSAEQRRQVWRDALNGGVLSGLGWVLGQSLGSKVCGLLDPLPLASYSFEYVLWSTLIGTVVGTYLFVWLWLMALHWCDSRGFGVRIESTHTQVGFAAILSALTFGILFPHLLAWLIQVVGSNHK